MNNLELIKSLLETIEFGELHIKIQDKKIVLIEEIKKHKPKGEK